MKTLLLSILLISATNLGFGQNIDNLNSTSAVENFIRLVDERYQEFTLKPITEYVNHYGEIDVYKKNADSLNITESYFKADIDNNGYTDLLAIGMDNGFNVIVVMNEGGEHFKIHRLTRGIFQKCIFPKIINDTLVRLYYTAKTDWREDSSTSPTLLFDDLVFKYGNFVEYNPQPQSYSIEKIEFQTTACFGTCPIFSMTIDKHKSAVYKAVAYNYRKRGGKEVKGKFKTVVEGYSFDEIISLLNYIDFPNLEDNYAVEWTDDQTSSLTITYNNGKVKTIRDYGLIGTYGLVRLYEFLFELRSNQKWK